MFTELTIVDFCFAEYRCDAAFVGTMAYKAKTKIELENAVAVADIVHRESEKKDGGHPVQFIGLFQPFWNEPLMLNAVMDHGIYFQKAYCALLTGIGYTHSQVCRFQ